MDPVIITFDESSPHWHRNGKSNLYFLLAQESYFNHMLHARGHVFLNEVHDALGLPRTAQGQLVGWEIMDRPIEFGLPDEAEFDSAVILNLNVEGEIYQSLDRK